MIDSDEDYCLRRAEEERERAAACDDPDSARRHAALADLFQLRATDHGAWEELSTQQC